MVNSKMLGLDISKRLILFLFLLLACGFIGVALWPCCWLFLTFAPQTNTPFQWVLLILGAILVFNYVYILAVLAFRLIIPCPKEGFFPIQSDGKPPRQALILMLNLLLIKMLYHTPWAKLFTTVLTNIFPLSHIFRRIFGPNTSSVTMGSTVRDLARCRDRTSFSYCHLLCCFSWDSCWAVRILGRQPCKKNQKLGK